MKPRKISKLTISLVILFCILILLSVCSCDIKHSKYYSAIDYVRIKNIVSQNKTQTNEMITKYDFNKDDIITNLDADIVRQMLDGYYDSYLVIGKYRYVIRRNK